MKRLSKQIFLLVAACVSPCMGTALAQTLPHGQRMLKGHAFTPPRNAPPKISTASTSLSAVNNAYPHLDNIEGTWVSFNEPPVRPMVYDEGTLELFALNAHDSTLQRFDTFGPAADTWRLPWNPRSLALYDSTSTTHTQQILVTCAGNSALVALDRSTGEIIDLLELPAEPADLLVDQAARRAFVSCSALDLVVEVDLAGAALTIARTFAIPSKNPVFLAFDGTAAKNVLVTPMVSGNNSICDKPILPNLSGTNNAEGPRGILDLELPGVAQNKLPDHDLFRLDRASGAVVPIGTDLGTILTAHGLNSTGQNRYWVLNTEANNKGARGEAAIQGKVVFNRVSIFNTLPTGSGGPATPWKVVELDDFDSSTSGVQYDRARSLGQPWALEFTPTGHVFIAGLLTDNVHVRDANGDFSYEFDLDDGAIPRALHYSPQHIVLFVYEWGRNKVSARDMRTVPPTKIWEFDLGHDPAPAVVQEGRELFYDGWFSEHNNASCASCHVDGRTDKLAWDLGDVQLDDKGPMVTQTLAGSAFTLPYHWRGDNDTLEDFNDAFLNLLGAPRALTPSDPATPFGAEEFEAFQAFVTSIAPLANPNQHPERVLDASIQPPLRAGTTLTANALAGRDIYGTWTGTCSGCHALPHGTSNEISKDNPSPIEVRNGLKVTAFNEMWRKEPAQNLEVLITLLDSMGNPEPPRAYPPTGFGLAHSGNFTSGHHFHQVFDIQNTLTHQQIADVTAFVHVWDSGIAPAVQKARVLTKANRALVEPWLRTYLVPQAKARNCDIAVFGRVQIGAAVRELSWFYDRVADVFVCEDPTVANVSLAFFDTEAAQDRSNTFVGLPVGMGERFGVDFDEDDLYNGREASLGTGIYLADTDGDGWPDGHEDKNGGNPLDGLVLPIDSTAPTVRYADGLFATARQGRLVLETDEPTSLRLDYSIPGQPGSLRSVSSHGFKKHHDLVLDGMLPSTLARPMVPATVNVYQGTLTVTDLAGNSPVSAPALPAFKVNGFRLGGALPNLVAWFFSTISPGEVRISSLTDSMSRTGNAMTITLNATVERLIDGPPAIPVSGYHVIARVFVNGVQSTTFTSADRVNTIHIAAMPYTRLPGPYLMLPATGTMGTATTTLTVPNLTSGDIVHVDVEFVEAQDGNTPTPSFPGLTSWSLPHSPKDDLVNCRTRTFEF